MLSEDGCDNQFPLAFPGCISQGKVTGKWKAVLFLLHCKREAFIWQGTSVASRGSQLFLASSHGYDSDSTWLELFPGYSGKLNIS